jgi:hypothetical protein
LIQFINDVRYFWTLQNSKSFFTCWSVFCFSLTPILSWVRLSYVRFG